MARLVLILLFAFIININQSHCFFHKRRFQLDRGNVEGLELPDSQWFDQKLDHFNPTLGKTWKQRYFTNDTFFDKNNPNVVFLMIGGEGPASAEWMVKGQWIEYAQRFKALCFQLEHRFYGESHPTVDLSTKNLVYLNSQQALADLAYFIISKNDEYKFDSSVKWIVFGGSYPGSLAAWMRLKYPHLVHGAVSSSGPLLAKVDFMEYFSVVVDALRYTSGDECVESIKEGVEQIKTLSKHMIGLRTINEKFKLCDPIEKASKLDMQSFYESIAGNFAGVVQYNKDNRFGKSATNITIDLLCRLMTDKAAGTNLDRLANINSLLLDKSNETCLDYKYDKAIDEMRNISWDGEGSEGGRQWMYQTCNEFGFYQTSGGEPEIFSNEFPVSFFIQQCMDVFGAKFNEDYLNNAVERTNMMYGGLDIQGNNIVFVHGSIDPWHALGITKTKENLAPAIYIKGTAHCANMYPPSENDLPELKAAREMIGELLEIWLQK